MQEGPIVNKVAKSGLITIDLQEYYDDTPIETFDLKDHLYQGLIIREKDFRKALDQHDWTRYAGTYVAVHCSSDAIIASWAYMLVTTYAQVYAREVFFGNRDDVRFELYRRKLENIDWSQYEGSRIILKGCSDKPVPPSVYLLATKKLLPYAERVMYGEACSFVPVYREGK
ncbi:MAG TPA: DUF2480 family protein [Balneolales bacterium]|nr:DUF2480 family protein [Balneolales bacterium]